MNETTLIQFQGRDRAGLIAELTAILATHNTTILDIGQAVVHETLSLGLLVEFPEDQQPRSVQTALSQKSAELGLQVSFTPIAQHDLQSWISTQECDQFIVTILGRAITAVHLARVTAIVASHGL